MLDQLTFDTTDANTQADSSNVGAYLRSSDGTLITHTNDAGNSKDRLDVLSVISDEAGNAVGVTSNALDVNIASGTVTATCDLDGVYNGATNTDPDNVGMILHTRNAAPGDAQQVERTTAGGLATVASGSLANVNAMDVNAFAYAIDGTSGDAELLTTDGTSGGLNVHLAGGTLTTSDAALADTAIANASNDLGVANTAEDVVASPLANRKYLWIYNNGNRRIFIGSTGVTSANGFPMAPRALMELRAGPSIDIEWVGPNTNQQIRTLELS